MNIDQIIIDGLYPAHNNSSGTESELYMTLINYLQTDDEKYFKKAKMLYSSLEASQDWD